MKYYDKLIFELSRKGRCGYSLPDSPYQETTAAIPENLRRYRVLPFGQLYNEI